MFRIQLDAEVQSNTVSRSKDTFCFNGVISAKRHIVITPNRKSVPISLDLSSHKPMIDENLPKDVNLAEAQISLSFDLPPIDVNSRYTKKR